MIILRRTAPHALGAPPQTAYFIHDVTKLGFMWLSTAVPGAVPRAGESAEHEGIVHMTFAVEGGRVVPNANIVKEVA